MPITRSTLTSFALVLLTCLFVSCGSSSDSSSLSTDALLSDLTVDGVELDQTFQPAQDNYTASVHFLTSSISMLPFASDDAATLIVNGAAVASGSESGAIPLAEGNNIITLNVTAEDGATTSTYTFFINRAASDDFAQQAYLKASNAETNDRFGYKVAVSGDTLAVSAYYEDGDSASTAITPNDSATLAGVVYVFVRNGDSWTQQAYLKASNADVDDVFGISVAIDGDTLVVGATGEDGDSASTAFTPNENELKAGAAYVYTREGAVWSQEAYLKASNAESDDIFGISVALNGDILVVGASGEDGDNTSTTGTPNNNELSAGAAYVFIRDGDSWTEHAYLKANNATANNFFGASVAVSDYMVAVGAPNEEGDSDSTVNAPNDNISDAGAVYVFTRDGESWGQEAYLKASNAGANDYFGRSVVLDSTTLVVGAYGEDGDSASTTDTPNDNAASAGAAYVFTRVGDSWSQRAYLKASNAELDDWFGYSLALSGNTVVVGSAYESGDSDSTVEVPNGNELSAGAAYVFMRDGDSWTQESYLKASNAETADNFGWSVSIDGDTVAVGAYLEDSSTTGGESDASVENAGAVYVWQ